MPHARTADMTYAPQQIFQNLARYNERANREMVQHLAALTGRARRRDVGSWFRSIHGILNHVLICDINWLKRYRALAPGSPVLNDPRLDPPNLSWDHDLHDDFKDLAEHRAGVDGLIRAWFEACPASDYSEVFQYHDSVGDPTNGHGRASLRVPVSPPDPPPGADQPDSGYIRPAQQPGGQCRLP